MDTEYEEMSGTEEIFRKVREDADRDICAKYNPEMIRLLRQAMIEQMMEASIRSGMGVVAARHSAEYRLRAWEINEFTNAATSAKPSQ